MIPAREPKKVQDKTSALTKDVINIIKNDEVDRIKELFINGFKFDSYHLILAAEYDALHVYLCFLEMKIKPDTTISLVAGKNVLTWICNNGPINPLMGNRVIELLNDWEVCDRLYRTNGVRSYNEESVYLAAKSGNSKMLKWLCEIGIKIPADTYKYAITSCKIAIMDLLFILGAPIGTDIPPQTSEMKEWLAKYEEMTKKSPRDHLTFVSVLENSDGRKTRERKRSRSNAVTPKPKSVKG
jgi:hypothetical protein